jgi:hypothetical protein
MLYLHVSSICAYDTSSFKKIKKEGKKEVLCMQFQYVYISINTDLKERYASMGTMKSFASSGLMTLEGCLNKDMCNHRAPVFCASSHMRSSSHACTPNFSF